MARKSEGPWYRVGKGAWYVWHKGKLVRLAKDQEEALRLWRQLIDGEGTQAPPTLPVVSPPVPVAFPCPPPPSCPLLTVAKLVDAYLVDASLRLKPSTLRSKRKVLLRLKAALGDQPAASLKPAVLVSWLAQQTGWGRSLRWLAGVIVKACCRWAVDPAQGLLPANPAAGLRLPGPRSRGADALVGDDDHAKLMAAAPPEFQDALVALHGTGCRPGELCAVEARHYDARSQAWILDVHKTDHSGKVRVVLLPSAVVAICERLAAAHPTGPLFRGCKGQPLTPERLRSWVFKTRRRLGLGRVMPYSYRHRLATDALERGVPESQVAELLGHAGTIMLHKHYAHLGARVQALKDALGRVRT